MPSEHEDQIIRENELEPDPLLKEGRASRAWVWTVGIVIVAAVVITVVVVGQN